jgi:hypothetical protein
MGKLIQKAARQPNAEIRSAPTVGPDATPSAPTPPVHAITSVRRSRSKAPSSNPVDAGVSSAPPLPWMTRPAISVGIAGAMPHVKEPTRNSPAPSRNTRRRPRRSAVRPATTSSEPKTIE